MRASERRLLWSGGLLLASVIVAQVSVEPQSQGQQGQTGQAAQQGQGRQGGRGGRGVQIQPGEQCPPGMTETRPLTCQAPGFPIPSIVDYRPRNTLVTAAHPTPKAKFPAIDYHGHLRNLIESAEGIAEVVQALDALNVRLSIAADSLSGDRLTRVMAAIKASPHHDRIRVLAGINFANVGPGWAERAVAQLEKDVAAGAGGVGEISKSLGLTTRKADGTLLAVDDPDLDPIWAACARLNIPVFIHTADPAEFFAPIDEKNERWLELAVFTDRRYQADRYPRFETLMTQRDRVFKRHSKTQFIAAHLGWHGNNLARLGKMLDAMPNVATEMGAVLYELGRQPRAAREFLIKYQDRVLFGKDAWEPSEYPTYWRVLETKDEYFDYYRDYHAFWKMYGLDLPDEVLKKIYYKNALRLTRGLPQSGWPQ
jgi:predicted TIM-barrel fold metal-dependent hydrolase